MWNHINNNYSSNESDFYKHKISTGNSQNFWLKIEVWMTSYPLWDCIVYLFAVLGLHLKTHRLHNLLKHTESLHQCRLSCTLFACLNLTQSKQVPPPAKNVYLWAITSKDLQLYTLFHYRNHTQCYMLTSEIRGLLISSCLKTLITDSLESHRVVAFQMFGMEFIYEWFLCQLIDTPPCAHPAFLP